MPKKMVSIIATLLFLMIVLPGYVSDVQAKPVVKRAVKRQKLRNQYVKFETIIDALDIKEGMTILDIGAGPGYSSFLFAEKLHGTGQVFATDIRPDFVNHIADEAKKRHYANLFSALVKSDGLDGFYEKHRYDIVLVSNAYHCIDNPIDYFRKLRKCLKTNAQLVLVMYNQTPLFSVDDILNLNGLIDTLSETDDDPFVKHLLTTTMQLLKDKSETESFKTALIEDFNRMLTDPQFYQNFYSNSYFKKDLFTVRERDFANWLFMTLKEDGVFEKPVDQIDGKGMRTVIKLNRLFFSKRFGSHLENDGMGAYVATGDANRHTSKYAMFRELGAAGYVLSREIRVSPYFNAFIMVPATP